MTGGATSVAARRLALAALERVGHGAYLAPALGAALDESGLQGADRSLATDLAYGAARRQIQLDYALRPHLKAPGKLPPRVLIALRLGAYELLYRGTPSYAAVDAWVAVTKGRTPKLAGLVNAVLRRVEPLPEDAPGYVQASLPEWLLASFGRAVGAQNAALAAQAMLQPEPLWLTALRQEAAAVLAADGAQALELLPGTPPPASLRVRSPLPLARTAAYGQGLVQPQNPSSLQAALLLGAGAGDDVYDLAAGRGVKSAVLAAQGANVVSFEIDPARADAAAQNLARLGLSVRHKVADLTLRPDVKPVSHVILDAPCSGTGTLRGHPEIKLRLTQDQVLKLAALQRRLLTTAAELVAPGGTLVYAVCALTPEEGPEAVADLLARRPDLRLEPFELPLPTTAAAGDVGRYLLPLDGLDGFYLARLRRG